MKKTMVKALCVAFALAALSVPVYAESLVGSDYVESYLSDQEISPRYKNIIAAVPIANSTSVGGILEVRSSMRLSISARAYRNGKLVGTYGDSGSGTSLSFSDPANLKVGDVVEFTFNAGGEIQDASITVAR